MERFLQQRTSDPRYRQAQARVDMPTQHWYHNAPVAGEDAALRARRFPVQQHVFSAKTEEKTAEARSDDKPKKKRKHENPRNDGSATSDNSDRGECQSDYERVPDTTYGSKGSCRPKGSAKKD